MVLLMFFLACLTDPIRLIVAILVMLAGHQKWLIPVAAAVSTAVSAAILGHRPANLLPLILVASFTAGLVHAGLFYWLRTVIARRRKVAAAAEE